GDTIELDLGAVVTNADQVSEDDQWHEVENEDPSGPTVYVGKIEDDIITLLVHGDEIVD
ncbi:MAG: hypothetical protein HRT43_14415, partial [Campylobacteraceae bacterium]|nr:hypothetical protein [Campylobacteraceae bacterium]